MSTPDNDSAIRLLYAAAADGRLTFDEADVRIARARAAGSQAELDALVADLGNATQPVPVVPVQVEAYPVRTFPEPTQKKQPGFDPKDRLVLSAGWGSDVRSGMWQIPPYLQANGGLGEVRIDCLRAQPLNPIIDLLITGSAGAVTLILPDGWAVESDRLTHSIGSAKVSVESVPAPGCPMFVVHGGVGIGSFTARYPNWFDRRRMRRLEKRTRELLR